MAIITIYKKGEKPRTVRHVELKMEEKTLVVRDVFNDPVVTIHGTAVSDFLDGKDVVVPGEGITVILNDKSWRGF